MEVSISVSLFLFSNYLCLKIVDDTYEHFTVDSFMVLRQYLERGYQTELKTKLHRPRSPVIGGIQFENVELCNP